MSSAFCLDILRSHMINSFDFFLFATLSTKRRPFVRFRKTFCAFSVKPHTAKTLSTGHCGTEGLNGIVRVGEWVAWLLYALRSREIEHRADWGRTRLCVFVSVCRCGCVCVCARACVCICWFIHACFWFAKLCSATVFAVYHYLLFFFPLTMFFTDGVIYLWSWVYLSQFCSFFRLTVVILNRGSSIFKVDNHWYGQL